MRHPRRHLRAVSIALAAVLGLSSTLHAQSGACYLAVNLFNTSRSVFGTVSAECSGDVINCFPFFGHSVPWGNWGVDSNFSSRTNGDQFMGWKDIDGQQQWNSCTIDFSGPNSEYYNADDYTTQQTDTGVGFAGGYIYGVLPNTPCHQVNLDGYVITANGNYMDLWELDGCDEDEWVALIEYPNLSVTLSWTGSGWGGQSDWVWPTSVTPNVVTAQAQLSAGTFWGCIPGLGCG